MGGHWDTRQMPTATHRENIAIATAGLAEVSRELNVLLSGPLMRLEA